MNAPYRRPVVPQPPDHTGLEYVGFWLRVVASLVDTVVILLLTAPLMIAIYGMAYYTHSGGRWFAGVWDFVLTFCLPIAASVYLWVRFGATPGKMMVSAKIVDASTGRPPSVEQSLIRYFSYFISVIPLGLGIFWVAFDAKKQGWHDHIANTLVVRPKPLQGVTFGRTPAD